MNVLIVGGAGYLGGALTDILDLQRDKHTVRVYDSLVFEESYRKDVDFVRGDIRDHAKLQEQLDWADTVVWLAAIVGDGACAINPALSTELNQESVKHLAENFKGRIIFMSTCSVYGAMDGILTEDSATNPLSVYATTKLAAEKYLQNSNAFILRLGTLFGVGDDYSRLRMDLVVNTMSARAFYEGKLKVFGGEQYRPLLHVRDAAQCIANNLDSDKQGIYNLYAGNMKMLDLAKKITSIIPAEIDVVETTFEDSRNYRVSSKLDYQTQYTVEGGVFQLVNLFVDDRITDINNPRYSNHGFLELINGT